MRYFFRALGDDFDAASKEADCVDLVAARRYAILYAADAIRNRPDHVWGGDELRIEVTEANGLTVTTVVLLSIDAKGPNEVIHISRHTHAGGREPPTYVTGSGGASIRRHETTR